MTMTSIKTKAKSLQLAEKALEENTRPAAGAKLLIEAALALNPRGAVRAALEDAYKVASGERTTDLTDAEYRAIKPGAKLVDPDRPGLLLKNTARQGKVWVFRFKHPETNNRIELRFGSYPAMGVADARTVWRDLRDQRNAGRVPVLTGTVDGIVTAGGAVMTMGALADRYLKEYSARVKRPASIEDDRRLLDLYILPHYADTPVANFDHAVVAAILGPLHDEKPRQAEKLRALLSGMFNVARGRTKKISTLGGSWIAPDFPNPVENITLPKREAKNHNPAVKDMKMFVRGLDDMGVAGPVLHLQVETFARIGEVVNLPWSELDLDEGVWRLPAERAKNGRGHDVMLARQTVSRLQEMREENVDNTFVFESTKIAGQPIQTSAVQTAFRLWRDGSDLPDAFVTHSLRHAGLTWVAENGGGKDIRDRLSNHAPSTDGVDHIYVAAELNSPAREWTQRWVDHLTGLESDNVVSITGRGRA